MTHPLLEGLDADQRAAVTDERHPLVIEAGAGSGKTRVLTRRIAYRVADEGLRPEHVLAVTFTRKAAGELRDRLRGLGVGGVVAGTFHSLAWAQLRRAWAMRGHSPPTEVIDRKAGALVPLLRRRGGAAARVEPGAVAAEIEWAKVRMVDPDQYARVAADRRGPLPPNELAEVYAQYEEAKRRRGAIDFEDMLGVLARAARSDPELLAELRARHRHVFVDEFQDTSPLGHAVLTAWVAPQAAADLCVVGDPCQAIFSFTGAERRFFSEFERHWPGAVRRRLRSNYRTRPPVVAVANAVLADGALTRGRPAPPPLVAQRGGGEHPVLTCHGDERAEAAAVAAFLRRHLTPGRPISAAVLYRTNAQSAVLEAALGAAGIPFRVRGDRSFLTRAEIRRAVAGLRARAGEPAPVALAAVLDAERARPGLDDDARANLDVLAGLGDEHHEVAGVATTAAFVEWLAHTASGDESASGPAVELVTLHRAKGLEWDTVAIVGCEAGLLPIGLARMPSEVDEERRLFYVGITRARERLLLTRAGRRHGGRGERRPSPFLAPVEAVVEALRGGADPADDWHRFLAAARAEAERIDPSVRAAVVAWRAQAAAAEGVPERVVLSDAVVDALARRRPSSTRDLAAVEGLDAVRAERFGADLLSVVAGRPLPARASEPAAAPPDLLRRLKEWRTATARAEGYPAYIVFRDATLEAVALRRPRTRAQLLRVDGVGPAKLERYGAALLALVAAADDPPALAS